jgi:hypothetical protein
MTPFSPNIHGEDEDNAYVVIHLSLIYISSLRSEFSQILGPFSFPSLFDAPKNVL